MGVGWVGLVGWVWVARPQRCVHGLDLWFGAASLAWVGGDHTWFWNCAASKSPVASREPHPFPG